MLPFDHDYWDFTAYVENGSTVAMGTAVMFGAALTGDPIPTVKPATADDDSVSGSGRTFYIGVAMQPGESTVDREATISVRAWAAGTMPALCDPDGILREAGLIWKWDGAKFIVDSTPSSKAYTAINMSEITDTDGPQICEFLIIKGGRQ